MDKIHLYDKILSPMVTEKSTNLSEQNKTKLAKGKKVKVSGFKKAIITLKKGQSIDLTTGI